MKLEFDVKVNSSMLYDFLLRHTYTSAQGLIGTCAGALFVVIFAMQPTRIAALVVGLIILIYLPVSLSLKAKAQALNPVFKKPIHYTMTEEGVMVSQQDDEDAEAAETEAAETEVAETEADEEVPKVTETDSEESETVEEEDTTPKPFPWDAMYKAVSTKQSIILYTTRVNACIFPRKQLGGKTTDVIKMICTNMPAKRVKIRY